MIPGFGIVEFSVMNESGSLFALRYQSCYVTVLTKYLPIIYPQAICISVQYKGTFIAHCIGPAPIKCGNLYVLLLDRVTVDTDTQCGNRIIAGGVGGGKNRAATREPFGCWGGRQDYGTGQKTQGGPA